MCCRFLCVAMLLCLSGCRPTGPVKSAFAPAPNSAIKLGMPLKEAIAACGSAGQEMRHEDLPVAPKPREAFQKLSEDARWLYWAGTDGVSLTLAIKNDVVIARMTHRKSTNSSGWEGEASQ